MCTMACWSDRATFLQAYLRHPLAVGSVTPSALALVDRMLHPIQWGEIQTVVELGCGTGPMTAEILRRKPAHVRFLAFEREPAFRQLLLARFPGLQVHPEAFELGRVLARTGRPQADVVLSGIPFAALPGPEQERLLDEVEQALVPGGLFVAFQYSPLLYRLFRGRFACLQPVSSC